MRFAISPAWHGQSGVPGRRFAPHVQSRSSKIYFLQQWFNLSDPAVEEALYDSVVMRHFVGIDLGREPVPDETTICKFRHLLEEHELGGEMLETVNLTYKRKECGSRPVRLWMQPSLADSTVLPELLHGEETRVWDDGAYQGQSEIIHQCAPQARDCTQRRCRYKDRIDEVERAKNRNKSRVRSKVEHVFGVMKLKFRFVKVRYRGLKKNANRMFATCALVNLFLVRKKLLRLATV